MLFSGDACQLITAERLARKAQLSDGMEDFAADGRMIAAEQ
jgi:hypothetical protein